MVAEGYKESEIGVIPVDWEVVHLDDITMKITSGGTPSRSKDEYFINGTINWLKTGELRDCYIYGAKEKITEEAINNSSAKLFPIDTLLIAMYGATIGQTAYLKTECATNQACCAIMFDKELASPFFYWKYFYFIKDTLIGLGRGAGQPNISQGIIKELKIPLPPLKEQEKIADILSTADEKIDAIALQITKTEELKKALLQKLLSEGIGYSEFKDSELGKIPEGWEITTVGNSSKNFDGQRVPLKSEDRQAIQGKYPYYGAQGIIDYVNDYIFDGEYLLVAEDGENVKGQKYDIAFVVNDKFWVNNHAHILQANDNMDLYFISSILNHINIIKYVTGTGQPKLNKAQLNSIKIPLPSLKEQKQIADILSTADKKLEVLCAKKQKYEILKIGLLQKLLSGEVRV